MSDTTDESETATDRVEELKVTSPRMEQDEFTLTPSGQPDRPDASRLDNYYTKTRAVHEGPVEDDTEQKSLFDDGGSADE